jgi:hypothetical protein
MPENRPAPYPLAMVIADAIWRDPGTGKRTILGCFSSIVASEFPMVHPQLAVYVAVTDGHGTMPVKLQIVDAEDEGRIILVAEGDVEFPNPKVIVEMDYHFAGVSFPSPGEYRIQLFAQGQFLLERLIFVEQAA